MKRFFLGILCVIAVFGLYVGNTEAQQQQTLTVTVNNTALDIPVTPTIVRSENVSTNTLDLVVEVGSVHANQMLDFAVVVRNLSAGTEVTQSFHQAVNGSSRTSLAVTSLIPGTRYEFRVRYSRDGQNIYSANSNAHQVTTAINPPILNSIGNVDGDSATVNVGIDPAFVGSNMDYIVEVKNEDTGDTYTVQMTKNATSGSVDLNIDDLDPGAEYSFRVRYGRAGTSDLSGYSNSKSAVTDLDAPNIDDIRNTTSTSMDLRVEVDSSFAGEDAEFEVEITNEDTGGKSTVKMTRRVGGDSAALLSVSGLTPGTNYSFRVRYAREGSSHYSGYSNSKGDHTEPADEGEVVNPPSNGTDTQPSTPPTGGDPDGGLPGIIDKLFGGSEEVIETGEEDDEIFGVEKEVLREAIAPPELKSAYQTAAAVGAAASSVAALAGSAVPLFAATPGAFSSSLFLKLIELFGIIGRRKEERNWGTVFDRATHMPIPATKIVLIDEMGNEMSTTYSDKDGRFGFLATPGKYLLQVFKKDYELITNISEDELYGNIYNGEPIVISEDNVILSNIAMKSLRYDWAKFAERKISQYQSKFSTFKKAFFIALYVFGFGATIVITYFYPSVFNFVVLGIYVIMFVYQMFFKKKQYGLIETTDGKPVPFAIVSLHDHDSQQKRQFAVTDAIGRYYLLADNGQYKLRAKGQPVSGSAFEKQGDVHVKDGIVRKDIVV